MEDRNSNNEGQQMVNGAYGTRAYDGSGLTPNSTSLPQVGYIQPRADTSGTSECTQSFCTGGP